ncbi:IS110 family transposase [Thermus brockianus]|uniref:IS110 family transposase n=1 Tax=Thermus brockianus TaxID=56956 RepID=UPI001FCC969E|nr:IS110 family transposase [Thermus brockianus]
MALGSEVRRFPNPGGVPDLVAWLPSGAVVGLEATGNYHRPAAYALHRAGFRVYVLNPLALKAYARSMLRRAKTDRADARLIARYVAERYHELPLYEPSPEALLLTGLLVRVADAVRSDRVGVLNRLHAWQYVAPGVGEVLSALEVGLAQYRWDFEARARAIVEADPVLARWYEALQSLPGIGPAIALRVLAYSGDMGRFRSARAYAAFTGLTPRVYQSGTLPEVGRISRFGPPALRAAFWWAALQASRFDPERRAWVEALVARGKPKKVAITALANHLARAAWAVCVGVDGGGLDKRGG